jgi:iron-sulfur cluster assembly protein
MLSITPEAADKLRMALDPGDVVRVGVTSGGCSGYRYSLAIETGHREDDVIVEFDDVKVCMDADSSEMLSHTVVHYDDNEWEPGFKFSNVKATGTCGCGSSFSQAQDCSSNTEPAAEQ